MKAALRHISLLALFATLSTAALAHADEGGVELVNGGRINGNVMAVLPGERVAIRLADGTALEIAWADVRRVFDGPRVFDASGELRTAPVVPPAPAPGPASPAPLRSDPEVLLVQAQSRSLPAGGSAVGSAAFRTPQGTPGEAVRLLIAYESLPSPVGSAWLMVGGVLFALNGTGMLASGLAIGCDEYVGCGFGVGMSVGGVLSLSVGVLMTTVSIRRRHRRARGLLELSNGHAALSRRAPRASLDAHIDAQAFVPQLTLTF